MKKQTGTRTSFHAHFKLLNRLEEVGGVVYGGKSTVGEFLLYEYNATKSYCFMLIRACEEFGLITVSMLGKRAEQINRYADTRMIKRELRDIRYLGLGHPKPRYLTISVITAGSYCIRITPKGQEYLKDYNLARKYACLAYNQFLELERTHQKRYRRGVETPFDYSTQQPDFNRLDFWEGFNDIKWNASFLSSVEGTEWKATKMKER